MIILQKRVVSYFIVGVLFFLVSGQSVNGSCDPVRSTVVIEVQLNESLFSEEKKCLDENCSFFLEDSSIFFDVKKSNNSLDRIATIHKYKNKKDEIYIYNSSFTYKGRYGTSNIIAIHSDEAGFLNALEELVEDDIGEIKQILIQEMDSWAWKKEGNKLVITKYTQEKEKELTDRKKQFHSCNYFDYKRVGNWLFVYTGLYDHCYFIVGLHSTCIDGTASAIHSVKFFVFLLTNISKETIPYLIPYLIIIFVFGGIIYHLIRRKKFGKKLWSFLKPSIMKIGITIVMQMFLMFVLLLMGIFSLNISLCLFPLSYFIVSSINHIYFKNSR